MPSSTPLETKFVAANTLIGIKKQMVDIFDQAEPEVKLLELKLKDNPMMTSCT